MNFKQRFKCLIEQIIIGFFIFMIFLIIGAIASSVISGLFGGISYNIYYIIRNILSSIYIVFAVVIGVTVLLHIFKIRYLDYYEIVNEDNDEEVEKSNEEKQERYDEKRKIFIEKKKEKIIIRDPDHSESKFLTELFRIILSFIKFMAICTGIGFAFSFLALACLLVLSFTFAKAGLVFWGCLLAIISAMIVNFIILELLYNFIISKKSKKTRMAVSFIVTLLLGGISIGMILIGITQFNYVKDSSSINEIEEVYEYKMTNNLSINSWNQITKYVEEDTEDVRIVVKHSQYLTANITDRNEILEIYCIPNEAKTMEAIKSIINDINNRKIINYYTPEVYIYASKENIEKMLQNNEYNLSIKSKLEEAYEDNENMENEIYDLKADIS